MQCGKHLIKKYKKIGENQQSPSYKPLAELIKQPTSDMSGVN